MLNAKTLVPETSAETGQHVSTVYRKSQRDGLGDQVLPELKGYYGVVAQRAACPKACMTLETGALCWSAQSGDQTIQERSPLIAASSACRAVGSPEQIAG